MMTLARETEREIEGAAGEPARTSLAAHELETFSSPEMLETAYGQGTMLAVAVRDHFEGLIRALAEPVLTVSPWSGARSTLESAALSCWLLDPCVTARERVARSFAFRYEGLHQQATIARRSGNSAAVDRTTKRLDEIADQALALGYADIVNKKGRRYSAGMPMPSMTNLTDSVLDCGGSYKVFSAMVHAHPWALQQLGFRGIQSEDGSPLTVKGKSGDLFLFQKGFPIVAIQFIAVKAGGAFLKTHRCEWQLFGREMSSLETIHKQFYQQVRQ
jgi:hypothetical protein